jgi:hypothetical protein
VVGEVQRIARRRPLAPYEVRHRPTTTQATVPMPADRCGP